ncbi:MAG: MFS transporter, partial [Peristeroidobacter soli]
MKIIIPIALCMAVAVLEGFDIQAMGVAMPRLGPEFGLDAGAKGWLFSVNNIGMVLGAAVGGWLADRTGRRPVLLCAVATFGLFTF